ncbi:MAG: GNAT family N-acetyltransferase [Bacteroidota bacterium]
MTYKTFNSERLHLRPTSKEDAEFIYHLVNTPKWIKYVGDRNINSSKDARDYIGMKMLPQLERLGFGNFTLIRLSDKAKIGTCGMYDREGTDGFDIGYALLPDYENQGYASEAAKKLMEVSFSEFNIKRLSAFTTKDHRASIKLLEKLGFKVKGTLDFPDDEEELLHYRIDL